MKVPIEVGANGYIPHYASMGAGAADLYATTPTTIDPDTVSMVDTGIKVAIPDGYVGMVVSRSGLAYRERVVVLNSPGIIDSDYRGVVSVLIWNTHKSNSFHINRGDRIAQLLIVPVEQVGFEEYNSLEATERGSGGFGSTGVS